MKKIISFFKILLIVSFILFEEIIWDNFVIKIVNSIKSSYIATYLEYFIRKLGPYGSLFLFTLPFIFGELTGIISGYFVITGYMLIAVLLYIFKILITSLAFWIFSLNREKLLSISYFNFAYELVIQIFEKLKSTEIYIKITTLVKRLKIMKNNGELKEMYQEIKTVLKKYLNKE